MTSLAHQIGELLRAERELGAQQTTRELVWLWGLRRDLYFRVAHECSATGDRPAATAAYMAAGRAVTMTHRVSGIGVCPACGAVDLVTCYGATGDHERNMWHCGDCGNTWETPAWAERPTDLLRDTPDPDSHQNGP